MCPSHRRMKAAEHAVDRCSCDAWTVQTSDYYRNYLVRYGIYRSPAGHSSNAFMVSMDAFQG